MPVVPSELGHLTHETLQRNDDQTAECWSWNDALHSVQDHPSVVVYDRYGRIIEKQWHTHGQRHRDGDQPAWIKEGVKLYYKTNELHREGGPAWVGKGTEKWYKHGQLHRLDGPSIITEDRVLWHIEGQHYTLQQWGDDPRTDNELFTWFKLLYG